MDFYIRVLQGAVKRAFSSLKNVLYVCLSVIVILLYLWLRCYFYQSPNFHITEKNHEYQGPAHLESFNTDLSCEYSGKPICCALVDRNHEKYSHIYPREKDLENSWQFSSSSSSSSSVNSMLSFKNRKSPLICIVTREYIPSPYEISHINKALEIQNSFPDDEEQRREALLDFMFSDIKHANIWLKRVAELSQTSSSPSSPSEDDFEYLSRFKVTRKCSRDASSSSKRDSTSTATRRKKPGNRSNGGGSGSGSVSSGHEYSWYEWIEPITVYARHPFSYLQCQPKKGRKHNLKLSSSYDGVIYKEEREPIEVIPPSLINTDYILIQNSADVNELERYSSFNSKRSPIPPKHYFFDSGSSTFDSSLNQFLCSYLQVIRL
jgi:hypothetical protein